MSDPAPADVAPAEPAAPAAPPAPAAPAPEATPPVGEPTPDAQTFGAEYVEKLRRESATYRTKAKEAADAQAAVLAEKTAVEQQAAQFKAILDGITKAVNGDTDEPADPAKLAEQLAAEKAQRESDVAALTAEHNAKVRDLTVRATLPAALAKAGADPDLTTAVLTAGGVLSKLDPSSDTFAADLESAVQSAVESNPKLKVAPVAVRSGAEITGRSGGSDQVTREQLSRMSPAEIEKARTDGRLKNLLAGG